MAGRLWAFSGLDGAGKSTQIDLLCGALAACGRRHRRVWARGGYTPLFSFAKAVVRRMRSRALPPPGRSAERARRFGSPGVRRAWLVCAMVDLFLYYAVWIRILRWRGIDVVADRWVEDTALDFMLNFPGEIATEWRLWRLVARAAPRPDGHFFLVIPVEESLRRSQLKNEPFPDDEAVLRLRLEHYERAVAAGCGLRVDGLRAREELHGELRAICELP